MFSSFSKFAPLLSLGLPVFCWNSLQQRRQNISCCGIIGVLTVQKNAEEIVMEGVHLLENRGYDSAGIVTIQQNEDGTKQVPKYIYLQNKQFVVSKYASDHVTKQDCFQKIQKELKLHLNSQTGLGHTRWATCGAKIDRNAHPHLDMSQRVALVHNGTLENYQELKEQLIKSYDTKFTSDTDTEVIVQWIGQYLNQGMDLLQSVEQTLTHLQGQWGLVVIDKENPDQMVVCRQGSPILVGYNNDSIFAASEKIAFEKYTQNFISLKDGEVMLLRLAERTSFFNQIRHRIQCVGMLNSPQYNEIQQGYMSFFEQEIFEQPNSCLRALGNGGRLAGQADNTKLGGLERFEDEVCGCENLVFIACGSSYYSAMSVLPIFRALRIFETVTITEGSEFTLNDLPQTKPIVIIISQSGETKDLVKALMEAKSQGAFSIGIINVVGSLLANEVDCGIYLNCGREVGVAASKSFTSSIVALILLAVWLSFHQEKKQKSKHQFKQLRQKLVEQLRSFPISIGQCLHECHEEVKKVFVSIYKKLQQVSLALLNYRSIIIIGKGSCAAIAREGALKIKELTYKHAEAFSAGELKHGPLALIDSNNEKSTPVILIMLNNEYLKDMQLALSEIHSNNALTIVITNCSNLLVRDKNKIDYMINIPSIGHELDWVLSVVPFQMIALELCQLLQLNPDKPRNLAKTVTVG